MKTPVWEVTPGALEALLETDQWVECDLYTYTAADGSVLGRYATADINITINGITWLTGDPVHGPVGGTRPTAHWKIGLDVDSWMVRVSPQRVNPITGSNFPALLAGQPWVQSAKSGGLAGAAMQVDRAYAAEWPTSAANWGALGFSPVGQLTLFAGPVASVDSEQGSVIVTANDWRVTLDVQMPRRSFATNCRHLVYDSGCTLVRSMFSRTGSVGTVINQAAFTSTVAAPPGSGTYSLGLLTMTSGANNTFTRFIRQWNNGTGRFDLLPPPPTWMAPGDTFSVSAGCDKTSTTCTLFGNYPTNWSAEQFTPAPETAV